MGARAATIPLKVETGYVKWISKASMRSSKKLITNEENVLGGKMNEKHVKYRFDPL